MITQDVDKDSVRSGTRNAKLKGTLSGAALFLFGVFLVSSYLTGTAMATPAAGVTQTPIGSGTLAEPIRVKFKQGGGSGDALDVPDHAKLENTIVDVSNVAVVKNVVQPGGYFGWHQHSGPSWIVMTQGTLTFYDDDEPGCAGVPVSAGQVYFDAGNHTHNARNETNQPAENYVVRMLPAGGAPRIDMPNPGVCPGLP